MAHQLGDDACVTCSRVVTSRQHAIRCDSCSLWVHRICGTGIPQDEYRRAVRGESVINYTCVLCIRSANVHNDSPLRRLAPLSPTSDGTSLLVATDDEDELEVSTIGNGSAMDASLPVDMDSSEVDDLSHNDTAASYAIPNVVEEEELANMSAHASDHEESFTLTFQQVECGTKRGKTKLIDSKGYTYNMKRTSEYRTEWQCTVRSRQVRCKSSVKQRGQQYKLKYQLKLKKQRLTTFSNLLAQLYRML